MLFLEIHSSAGHYQARIYQSDPNNAFPLPDLALGSDASIAIKDNTYTLSALLQALIDFNPQVLETVFDERGQLELGRHLYAETLGRWEASSRTFNVEPPVQLCILTEDEHIARLPWVLLARGGVFLTTAGWSITLGRAGPPGDYQLPPSPRMLVIIPQPDGVPDTQAEVHLEELEEMLSQADHHFYRGRHLQIARTWEEAQQYITTRHYDLLYYYGHGIGDRHRSRLVFAAGKNRKREDIPVADLAACLRRAPDGPPLLAYINCCQGDAGGLLGAGRQLLELIPAVVTNRTIAYIDAARRQGLEFWRATLLEGIPPHTAVAEMYSRLGDMGLSLKNVRWMTPVLHSHYRTWQASPPQTQTRLDRNPHWRLKLDRVRQFSQVVYQTGQMLRERKPRALAYIWYGQEGQGVDLFHQRLKVEVQEIHPDLHLYEVRPRWPDDLNTIHRSFQDMLLEAFEVLSLDAIPDRIRTQTRGESGRQILVYVRHEPVLPGEIIKPPALRTYLEWWDCEFAPRLRQAQAFGLLGVSFIVNKPKKFLDLLTQRLDHLELEDMVVHVLDEMERLAKKDLRDFLDTHNIALPRRRRERILDSILSETEGHYEMTLEALKALVERAWDLEDEGRDGEKVSEGADEDY